MSTSQYINVKINGYEIEIEGTCQVETYEGRGGDDPSEATITDIDFGDVDQVLADHAAWNPEEDAYRDGVYYVNGVKLFSRDEFIAVAEVQFENQVRDALCDPFHSAYDRAYDDRCDRDWND